MSLKIYAGLKYKILINFPPNYPMAPPAIKFDSPCYHPNVDINGGGICLDILQVSNSWLVVPAPSAHVATRTNGLQYIAYRPSCFPSNPCLVVGSCHSCFRVCTVYDAFAEPNNASPLNPDAAAIWDSPEGRRICALASIA